MKGINYYALIVSVALVLVVFLLGSKSCKKDNPVEVENAARVHDSLVAVIETTDEVQQYLLDKNTKDSLQFERRIKELSTAKVLAEVNVSGLKKRVSVLIQKYEESKNTPEHASAFCDSLVDENAMMIEAFEKQTIVTDSIISFQEIRIFKQNVLIKQQAEFRADFINIDIAKNEQFRIVTDNYSTLYKRHNNAWNRWMKDALIGAAAGAAGFYIGKGVAK